MNNYKSLGGEIFDEPELIDDTIKGEYYDIKDGMLLSYRGGREVINIPRGVERLSPDFFKNSSPLKYLDLTPAAIDSEMLYTRTDKDGNPDPEGKYMLFGSYPQSRVREAKLVLALDELAGAKPRNGSDGTWTSYKYYIKDKNDTDYMWYQDITYGGERYRGVYFSSYRPYYTGNSSSADKSYQDDNDYYTDTVYWFKYEPLRWEIAEERDGKARLIAESLIDSQAYQNCYKGSSPDFYITDNKGNYITDNGGNKIYANNYEHSTIRAWLNGELLNTAFDEWERAQISLETVDNSRSSTGVNDNKYACTDTLDYIHLLSVKETDGMDTAAKQRVSTDYAKCQGVCVDFGNSWWWLRSPYGYESNRASGIYSGGGLDNCGVGDESSGVRPALWIEL